MQGDLGEQTAMTALDGAKKITELAGKLLKFLFESVFVKDYDKKLKKEQLKEIKENKAESFRAGYVKAKQMQKGKEDITYAKYGMTAEQVKEMNFHAKQRGIPISWIQNGHDKDTFIAMFRTKDSAIVEDITAQLIRDNKIRTIENAMHEATQTHYQKVSFDKVVNELGDGKLINPPVIVCDRNNPMNFMEVSSRQEQSEEGNPYVNTEYKVFHNGKQQKCDEFKHGKFTHYSDSKGNNTSTYGDEHWTNMKKEMKSKGEFTDDLLMFSSKEDYEKYVEQFQSDREQTEKESAFYDDLAGEKENVIREDIDTYNDKQAEALFGDMCNEKKSQALSFNDTVDRFQCDGWKKEEPYYICKRTDPDNYMEVNSEKAEFRGEEYTKHTYNLYVDDKTVDNDTREDKKWTDERFEGRPKEFWKQTKTQMKEAGEFTDDLVVFYSKEEMLEYRKVYEMQKNTAKESTLAYEADRESFKNDYAGIVNNLKSQMKQFKDIGKYENRSFTINTGDNLMKLPNVKDPRYVEAVVISNQIGTFEKMGSLSNEIASAKLQMQINEKSELKGSEMYTQTQETLSKKISDMEKQMKEYEKTVQDLSENREQIAGVKAERTVTDKDEMIETTHGEERISMEQLKEDIAKVQTERTTTTDKTHIKEHHKSKDDKDR